MSTPDIRSFNVLIGDLENGRFAGEASDKLRELVAAIEEADANGQKASGTITMKVSIKKDRGLLEVSVDLVAKLPKVVRQKSVFWATPENNLSRQNPAQHELGLHGVPAAAARSLA